MMSEGQKNVLEMMIDSQPGGLSAVCEALASVCLDKANHILESYNDPKTMKVWMTQAVKLQRTADAIRKAGL